MLLDDYEASDTDDGNMWRDVLHSKLILCAVCLHVSHKQSNYSNYFITQNFCQVWLQKENNLVKQEGSLIPVL